MLKQLLIAAVFTGLISCNSNNAANTNTNGTNTESTNTSTSDSDSENDEKTGEFTVDGKKYTGKVSTQTFANKNFSVLCQWDGKEADFILLQVTFHNEKEALNNKNLTLYHGNSLPMTEPNPNDYTINLSGYGESFTQESYFGAEGSNGTIKVEGRQLIITNMSLFTNDKQSKTVNATIPF